MRTLLTAATIATGTVLAAVVAPPPALAGTVHDVHLTAEEVVPRPGPAGAHGSASLDFVLHDGRLCYTLGYAGMAEPTAAMVHQGPYGVAGPVVVDLDIAGNGVAACIDADNDVLFRVAAAPDIHYLQLHTPDSPGGAIRGQLG
ncbi:hypothetical protein GCM10010123_33630 [Pilimelia anulata]|uniref:CHRD domain-containing protein n=1 Tax=Pilimelia anulata TaxID=53371 RepID=A0A8J3BE99_9ACTN|nr:CHRD domain-containing protein [Pilimelia anulata]GGK00934.1 hypothetical protein GCM10010123_33630 [Pilimelia anulata]